MQAGLRAALTAGAARPFNVAGLPVWSAAVRAARQGIAPARILAIGDSTVQGTNSQESNSFGLRDHAWPAELEKLIAANGRTPSSRRSSFFGSGSGFTLTSLLAMDPRWSGSAWVSGDYSTVGGKLFRLTNGTTGTLTFTPGGGFDTVDLWADHGTGAGLLEVVTGGVVRATINLATGAPKTAFYSITAPAGSTAVSFRRNSATNTTSLFFNAVAVRNASEARIEVMNGGWHGSRIADWLTSADPWSAYNGLTTFGQALTILCCNINDARNTTDLGTYRAGVLALLNRAREVGDAILMTSVPSDPATVSYVSQLAYVDAAMSAAQEAGAEVLDVWRARGGKYSAALMADNVHPTWAGYQDVAALTYRALGSP